MKFYLNRKPVIGPWGGGNRFITELVTQLKNLGHDVTYNFADCCDSYICFDPRPNNDGVTLEDFKRVRSRIGTPTSSDIFPSMICRVGDLGTHNKPELGKMWNDALHYANKIVFPSGWARDYCFDVIVNNNNHLEYYEKISSVIPNGVDKRFVDAYISKSFNNVELIKTITHHWSDNMMKGFSVYDNIATASKSIEFTYLGRVPSFVSYKNWIPPCDVLEIIKHLLKADVYLTASKFEAGANHVLEAMALGLPVVYSKYGGSIVEYCNGRGVEYDGTAQGALNAIHTCVESKITYPRYTRTVSDAVSEFIGVITR